MSSFRLRYSDESFAHNLFLITAALIQTVAASAARLSILETNLKIGRVRARTVLVSGRCGSILRLAKVFLTSLATRSTNHPARETAIPTMSAGTTLSAFNGMVSLKFRGAAVTESRASITALILLVPLRTCLVRCNMSRLLKGKKMRPDVYSNSSSQQASFKQTIL